MKKNLKFLDILSERSNLAYFSILIAGLFIISSAFYFSIQIRNSAKAEKFNDQVSHIEHTIKDNFDFNIRILAGAAGFFSGSDMVDRFEWDRYMSRLNPIDFGRGISFMAYVAAVPSGDKDEFVNRVRQDFRIYRHLADYRINPERESDFYYPINYIYPLSGSERGLGYDFGSDPSQIQLLEDARDSGELEVISLAESVFSSYGRELILFMPVYRNEARIDSVQNRRDALQGFVALGLSTRDFINSALSIRRLEKDLAVAIFDGPEMNEGNLLYSNYSRLPGDEGFVGDPEFDSRFVFNLDGRILAFHFIPKSDIRLGDFRDWLPNFALIVGIVFVLFASGAVRALSYSSGKIEKLASDLFSKWKESQSAYHLLIEEASDPIITIDEFGIVKYLNQAAEDIIGYSRKEIVGKTILDTGTVDIYDLPKALEHFKADLRGEKTKPFDLNMIKKSGERIILEAHSSVISSDPKIIQVLFRDVTRARVESGEMKKYSEGLEQMNRLLVGRELKMIELKAELDKLKNKDKERKP